MATHTSRSEEQIGAFPEFGAGRTLPAGDGDAQMDALEMTFCADIFG